MGGVDTSRSKVLGHAGSAISRSGQDGGHTPPKRGRIAAGHWSPIPAGGGSHRANRSQGPKKHPLHSTQEPGRGDESGAVPSTRRRPRSEHVELHGERSGSGYASSPEMSVGDGGNNGYGWRFGASSTTVGGRTEQDLSRTAVCAVKATSSKVTKPEAGRTSLESKACWRDGSAAGGIRCLPPLATLFCCVERGARLTPIEVELEEDAQELVEKLQVSKVHLSKLREVFDGLGAEASGGTVGCSEILKHVDMLKSPFTDHVFEMVGVNPEGAVTFCELCCILMTYCVYSRDDILHFLFRQYDRDESGAIDDYEFRELAKAVNDACPMFPGSFGKAVHEFDANSDGHIDFEEFRAMDKTFPLLFFPAFRMQDSLQAKFLGRDFWLKTQEGLAARQKASVALRSRTNASTTAP